LMQYWLNGRVPDTDEQKQLSQLQFDFYANELRSGNPYSITPAMPTVIHARTYLANFGGPTRIYQQMINAANKAAPSIDFNRLYPGSSAVVVDPYVVQGAFTKAGFTFMQDAIVHPEKYFSGEAWVLGDQAPPSLDPRTLTAQLASKYLGDYLSAWRTFLKSASVVKSRDLNDASAKLQTLSNPGSPLLQLFCTASRNTAVANQDISKPFQPTQVVTLSESCTERLVNDKNAPYITSLVGLQSAASQVAQDPSPPTNPMKFQPIISAAASARSAVSQLAQGFQLDPQAHLEQTSLALLQAPIIDAENKGKPQAAGNPACPGLSQLLSKYPFSSNATMEASPAEVNAIFQPGSGLLWQMLTSDPVKSLVVQQGSTFIQAINAPQKLNPAFLPFVNKAVSISNLLYPAGATSPTLTVTAHIRSQNVPSATLILDAQQLSGSDVSKQFTWSGQSSQAQLMATYGNASVPLAQSSGPWALFHLIGKGQVEPGGGPRYAYPVGLTNASTTVTGNTPIVHLEFSGPGASLLTPGALSGLHCVQKITQ
jgi:type VI secretion system protein ImpL